MTLSRVDCSVRPGLVVVTVVNLRDEAESCGKVFRIDLINWIDVYTLVPCLRFSSANFRKSILL